MSSGLSKMLPTNYSFISHIFITYKYKEDLASNNLQGLICHETQLKNPKSKNDII